VHLDRLAAQARSRLPAETEKLLRIMKLTEETGEVTQAVIGAMGQNPRKGVTHTRDEMLPLASRNPNDGRGGQGPFEMADFVYNVTPLKTTRKIAANTAVRPMVPKATGFDALRDSTLRTPCSSCASKYLL
jgi:hypothetical protein